MHIQSQTTPLAALEPALQKLAALIDRSADPASPGHIDPQAVGLSCLGLHRCVRPVGPTPGFYQPAMAVMVQGAKQVTLGDRTFVYDRAQYLLTSIDLPVIWQITGASEQTPYLCLSLQLDTALIGEMMAQMALEPPRAVPTCQGMSQSRLTPELLDAILRLARLLETPADIPMLAPLIEREILYRLLVGEQGLRLRHIAMANSQSQQIARAIDWLRNNYAAPLRIEHLARAVSMSPSSLHHHFKAITAMSPLQYQKQLRLQEARRLMLTEQMDAATASLRVGYESPSQFSREYSRLYGISPMKDVSRLRQSA